MSQKGEAARKTKKIPFPCMPKYVPRMKEWLLGKYAASTFNNCTHQPLPFIKADPICIHVDREAEPVAHHTPCMLPIHWRKKVKAGLDDDEKSGVVERVVVSKPNGDPRRTVDLSPMNKYCKREIHVTVLPFFSPGETYSSLYMEDIYRCLDGFHSALIREDLHLL